MGELGPLSQLDYGLGAMGHRRATEHSRSAFTLLGSMQLNRELKIILQHSLPKGLRSAMQ
jgi:hypothetical protein